MAADELVLKNGHRIVGKIDTFRTDLDPNTIYIDTGTIVMAVPRTNVAEVNVGVDPEYFREQARSSLQLAKTQLERNQKDAARRTIESAMHELDLGLDELGERPEALVALMNEMRALHRATLPQDRQSLEAEDLYLRALEYLDHVEYGPAFQALQRAAELAPERSDIQFELGKVARHQRQEDVAIRAFKQAVELNADLYYEEVSPTLLEMLERRGRLLLSDRRPDEAISVFEDILLFRAPNTKSPAALEDFLAKRALRAEQTKDEVLMEVYRYADDLDLVDLAFTAITRVEELRPENPEVKRLATKSRFLRDFNRSIEVGDYEEAARLTEELPEEFEDTEEIQERLNRLAGEQLPEVKAEKLLRDAAEAFEAGDFRKAADLAREVVLTYPDLEAAGHATELLAKAEIEAEVAELLAEVQGLVEDGRDDEALELLDEILAREELSSSQFWPELEHLQQSIPLEREAEDLLKLAEAALAEEDWERTLELYERVRDSYPETRAGRKARQWLIENRIRLLQRLNRYEPTETDPLSSLFDPTLWKAAAYPGRDPGELLRLEVPENMRGPAMQAFRAIQDDDITGEVDVRDPWLLVLAPLIFGSTLGLGLLWSMARPGSGQYVDPRELDAEMAEKNHGGTDPEMHAHRLESCRMCGQAVAGDTLTCPACGHSQQLSEAESDRARYQRRMADFDPWEIRVTASDPTKFQELFRRAKDLAETSDTQAAIDACREALHEDPHNALGYRLLADLYERAGMHDQATLCYREVHFLDPGDSVIRQKLEASYKAPTLDLGIIPWIVSACFWWMLFWVVQGFDPQAWLLRVVACAAGFVLLAFLMKRLAAGFLREIEIHPRSPIDTDHPLPKRDLTWSDQNAQARRLAEVIHRHTGIEVPTLTMWRFASALVLSAFLLIALIGVAWSLNAPWALLGWPAGLVLFVYLLEIHPRILTAHILLWHMREETMSFWADPHRPFRPNEGDFAGEFLIGKPGEFPLKWALRPEPYSKTRQGVLDSIQQTLNRHWAFHRFYRDLRIVHDWAMPVPRGFKTLTTLGMIIVAASLGGWGYLSFLEGRADQQYHDKLLEGYQYLLSGNLNRAEDLLIDAAALEPGRVSPHLYLAHTHATQGLDYAAERSFQNALAKEQSVSAAHNDFANFLQRQGRFAEAIAHYRAAMRTDEDNADIRSNLGSAYFKLQQYEQAVFSLREAVRLDPMHSRAYTTLGVALEELGRIDEARAAYEKAVEVAPDIPYTQVARGRLEVDMAPLDEAPITPEVDTPETAEEDV